MDHEEIGREAYCVRMHATRKHQGELFESGLMAHVAEREHRHWNGMILSSHELVCGIPYCQLRIFRRRCALNVVLQ